MSIRTKIFFVIMPIIASAVVLAGMSSYFAAAAAVTHVTSDALAFKASELEKYANGQWNLLVDNGFVGNPTMQTAAQAAIGSFAQSLLRSQTETILAFDARGSTTLSAGPATPKAEEKASLLALSKGSARGFATLPIGGKSYVAYYFPFTPFSWTVLVSEERKSFYGEVESIGQSTLFILIGSILIAIVMVLFISRFITRPLEDLMQAMRGIIEGKDFGQRVEIIYDDEIGLLSHTFNLMLEELGNAYKQIKEFAYGQAVAQTKERKIKLIFEKYVPSDVIDMVYGSSGDLLVGETRELAVLFCDIRSFTTISEKMSPNDLVDTLNRYFSFMVEVIMDRHGGMVDKFIGDAIMAYWGTPRKHEDDALQSTLAGLDMLEALQRFNQGQAERKLAPWAIGIGINYGELTVGNIGSERKMNYTVIGDMVNLASRLEGATKRYHQPILISENVEAEIRNTLRCRLVDKVAVKGKTEGGKIYTTRSALGPVESQAWDSHDQAIAAYYRRDFEAAISGFKKVLELLPGDTPAKFFLERAQRFKASPPPDSWDGVEILTEK